MPRGMCAALLKYAQLPIVETRVGIDASWQCAEAIAAVFLVVQRLIIRCSSRRAMDDAVTCELLMLSVSIIHLRAVALGI